MTIRQWLATVLWTTLAVLCLSVAFKVGVAVGWRQAERTVTAHAEQAKQRRTTQTSVTGVPFVWDATMPTDLQFDPKTGAVLAKCVP